MQLYYLETTYASILAWGEHMAYSEAQKEATARYNKKAYDRISVVVPKGQREVIASAARAQGKSVNQFIREAIDEKMKKWRPQQFADVTFCLCLWCCDFEKIFESRLNWFFWYYDLFVDC